MSKPYVVERFNPLDRDEAHQVVRIDGDTEHVLGFFIVGEDYRTFGAKVSSFIPEHHECQTCMGGASRVLWGLALAGGTAPSVAIDLDNGHGLALHLERAMLMADSTEIKQWIGD